MVIRSICGGGWGRGWPEEKEEEEEQIPTQITGAMSLSHGLQVAPAECHMPAGESRSKGAQTREKLVQSLSSGGWHGAAP